MNLLSIRNYSSPRYQFIFVTLEMDNSLSKEVGKVVWLLREETVQHVSMMHGIAPLQKVLPLKGS